MHFLLNSCIGTVCIRHMGKSEAVHRFEEAGHAGCALQGHILSLSAPLLSACWML